MSAVETVALSVGIPLNVGITIVAARDVYQSARNNWVDHYLRQTDARGKRKYTLDEAVAKFERFDKQDAVVGALMYSVLWFIAYPVNLIWRWMNHHKETPLQRQVASEERTQRLERENERLKREIERGQ